MVEICGSNNIQVQSCSILMEFIVMKIYVMLLLEEILKPVQLIQSKVFQTTDGTTWRQVLQNRGDGYSLMSAHCISENEAWVAGSNIVRPGFEAKVWHTTQSKGILCSNHLIISSTRIFIQTHFKNF